MKRKLLHHISYLIYFKAAIAMCFGLLVFWIDVARITTLLALLLLADGLTTFVFSFYHLRMKKGHWIAYFMEALAITALAISLLIVPAVRSGIFIVVGLWLGIGGFSQIVLSRHLKTRSKMWRLAIGNGIFSTCLGIFVFCFAFESFSPNIHLPALAVLSFGLLLAFTAYQSQSLKLL